MWKYFLPMFCVSLSACQPFETTVNVPDIFTSDSEQAAHPIGDIVYNISGTSKDKYKFHLVEGTLEEVLAAVKADANDKAFRVNVSFKFDVNASTYGYILDVMREFDIRPGKVTHFRPYNIAVMADGNVHDCEGYNPSKESIDSLIAPNNFMDVDAFKSKYQESGCFLMSETVYQNEQYTVLYSPKGYAKLSGIDGYFVDPKTIIK